TIEEFIHASFCDSNSIHSAVIDNDSDHEDVINKETNEENSKSAQNEESIRPVLSRQNGGDISILSPEPARESRTEQPTEAHQSSTPLRKPREWKSMRGYPHDFIIGNPSQGVTTRSSTKGNPNL
ncbi:hypothetical protein S83_008989, partial [Arachis hypogaea]